MARLKSIEFSSPSLSFAKASVRVDICEKDPQLAPRVLWNVLGKSFYETDWVKCFDELKFSSRRTSVYTGRDASLASPEHLAPVFLMWPSRRFNVQINSSPDGISHGNCSEIPLLDGSAILFFNGLRREAGVPEELLFYDAPVNGAWKICNGDGLAYGCVRISPSETFEVDYILDRPDLGGFHSECHVSVYSGEDLYHIFEARTFIFESEYRQALEQGLLKVANGDCGILIPDEIAASPEKLRKLYRVDEEPARHKVLDLLGDLTFVKPSLPKIRIEILNGGHKAHREILERILPYAVR